MFCSHSLPNTSKLHDRINTDWCDAMRTTSLVTEVMHLGTYQRCLLIWFIAASSRVRCSVSNVDILIYVTTRLLVIVNKSNLVRKPSIRIIPFVFNYSKYFVRLFEADIKLLIDAKSFTYTYLRSLVAMYLRMIESVHDLLRVNLPRPVFPSLRYISFVIKYSFVSVCVPTRISSLIHTIYLMRTCTCLHN